MKENVERIIQSKEDRYELICKSDLSLKDLQYIFLSISGLKLKSSSKEIAKRNLLAYIYNESYMDSMKFNYEKRETTNED